MSCHSCPFTPLNGSGGNTEGGRLVRQLKGCTAPPALPVPRDSVCCRIQESVQAAITPASSSYTETLASCGQPVRGRGSITQARARELLRMAGSRRQYESEGVRIQAVEQATVNCSTDPFNPTTRFSSYNSPLILLVCPPLPAPPAPPAKACPLTKNQKMLYT